MVCPSCRAENDAAAIACARCGAGLVAPTAVVVTVDLSTGMLFHGRYEILGPLGRGGMGMVYKARDKTLDEVVAIKVLRPDFAQDPKMAERFKSEIKLARKVRHRNVCGIHDYGEDRGLLYISMEMIEGVDLKKVLKEHGGLAPEKGYDVAIQVSEGLQAVHDAGIIHRDLKTPNIMLDAEGVARLMDFGIAKRSGSEGTMTATGHIVGTPEYMSPEQAQGHKVDFRSDIYALGIVTYEMFTGHVPFRGETPISTILKHLHDPPPLDGPAAERLPPDLKPVLKRALAKEPADRYANVRDFAEALRGARSPSRRQQPVPTSVLEAPTLQSGRPGRRRPLQAWLLVLPVVLLAGVAFSRFRQGSPESTVAAQLPPRTGPNGAAAPSAPGPNAAPSSPVLGPSPSPTGGMASSPAAAPTTVATPGPREAAAVLRRASSSPPTPAPRSTPRATPTPEPAAPLPTPVSMAAAPATPPPARETPGLGGLLQVSVLPWGTVTIDGGPAMETPFDKVSLAPGNHTVKIRNPGWELVERQVTIRPGQTEFLRVDFPKDGVRKP